MKEKTITIKDVYLFLTNTKPEDFPMTFDQCRKLRIAINNWISTMNEKTPTDAKCINCQNYSLGSKCAVRKNASIPLDILDKGCRLWVSKDYIPF